MNTYKGLKPKPIVGQGRSCRRLIFSKGKKFAPHQQWHSEADDKHLRPGILYLDGFINRAIGGTGKRPKQKGCGENAVEEKKKPEAKVISGSIADTFFAKEGVNIYVVS